MYALTLYNAHMGRFVALLAGALAIVAFLYGVFLLGAVAHAAGRTAAEREVGRLGAEVSRLESAYLTETKGLSLERAAAMGFVEPKNIATVYVQTQGLTLR